MSTHNATFRPGIESLEERCVPTTAKLSGGILDVAGTARSSAIVVHLSGGKLEVNGVRGSFRAGAVRLLEIQAGPGNEVIDIDSRLTTPALVICGAGDDVILGDAGYNLIVGGAGTDWFFNRGGTVTVSGGPAGLPVVNPQLGPAGPGNPGSPGNPPPASLGDQIAAEANSLVGQPKVGPNGVCTDLVQKVLGDNGADPNFGISGYNNEGEPDYTWGTLVYSQVGPMPVYGSLADVAPGDVIQFADVTVPGSNGWTWTAQQHTAIVVANYGNGALQLVEQNVGTDPTVQSDLWDVGQMSQGTVWVYQPQPA
jgi:hypothetical protein